MLRSALRCLALTRRAMTDVDDKTRHTMWSYAEIFYHSLIIFRAKEAVVLQKPAVYFKSAVNKLKKVEGKSYTPMAAA